MHVTTCTCWSEHFSIDTIVKKNSILVLILRNKIHYITENLRYLLVFVKNCLFRGGFYKIQLIFIWVLEKRLSM